MGKQFFLQFAKGRWMMLVASFYIKSFAGPNYVFGIYSIPIKASLNYNQSTIDTLSFFKDLGQNIGIVAGLITEVMPPWVVLTIGAALNLFGYLMIWLAVTHRIAKPPLWQMYLFMCIAADSHPFANTPVMVTCLHNFPHCRSILLGFVRGFSGLSGAIFSQLYYSLYNVNGDNTQDILLLLAWLPATMNLLCMFFIRPIKACSTSDKEDARNENKALFSFLYLALSLAAFLILVITLENQISLSFSAHKVIASTMVLLVASNILIAMKAQRGSSTKMQQLEGAKNAHSRTRDIQSMQSNGLNVQNSLDPTEASEPNKMGQESSTESAKKSNSATPRLYTTRFKEAFAVRGTKIGENFTIPEALLSWDMWILFIATACGQGAALAAIGNIGQIGESLGYTRAGISTLVSLMNIWTFLGRLLAGFASEALMRKQGMPRTLPFTISMLIGCVGMLLIAVPKKGSLYGASVIVGLSFGVQGTLFSAIMSELFGLKYYATLFNVGSLAGPLGSYFLNVRVAGYFYDRRAALQGDGLTCVGPHCFDTAFFIIAGVSFFGSLVSGLLVLRTLAFYRNVNSTK
ncbi:hypothetical protein GOP47_0016014 [Adiantum capillus-veneris]|uniref:Nodulin-like domain-containing protein n=1 Tax=Adiantum capillus-veneris TaxID=13818 RepID=A0A9D4ZBR2_ADICA|nr:hypothetical protein GOP47_0016014 [Adiantum capillus-veneris]